MVDQLTSLVETIRSTMHMLGFFWSLLAVAAFVMIVAQFRRDWQMSRRSLGLNRPDPLYWRVIAHFSDGKHTHSTSEPIYAWTPAAAVPLDLRTSEAFSPLIAYESIPMIASPVGAAEPAPLNEPAAESPAPEPIHSEPPTDWVCFCGQEDCPQRSDVWNSLSAPVRALIIAAMPAPPPGYSRDEDGELHVDIDKITGILPEPQAAAPSAGPRSPRRKKSSKKKTAKKRR